MRGQEQGLARLNIEDCWWTDPRRGALIRLLGSEDLADIAAVRMWKTAQEFWKHGRKWIPKEIFDLLPSADQLIQVRLATLGDGLVYVRGSSTYLDWLAESKASASKGGSVSAKRPRDKKGRLLPKESKRTPSDVQAESKRIQASSSYSSSSSSSGSKNLSFGKGETSEPEAPAVEAQLFESGEAGKGGTPESRLIAEYHVRWKAKHSGRAPLTPKDRSLLGLCAKEFGEARAVSLLEAYFEMPDAWFAQKRHDVGSFYANLSKVAAFADTGHTLTRVEANQHERTQANRNVAAEVADYFLKQGSGAT